MLPQVDVGEIDAIHERLQAADDGSGGARRHGSPGQGVTKGIAVAPGVKKTLTCVAVT